MNWIIAGFLVFACSVAQYLLIRRAGLAGMPVSVQNFSNFIVPLVLYLPLAAISRTSFVVTPYQLLILVGSAILFSYLGSKFSFMSIKYAPNPGYSLILSKSYVLMTTIVSVVFFHSILTVRAALAIVAIVIFSAFIMIDPKARHSQHTKPMWLPLSLGAFFCWGMLAISSKYLLEIGVPIYTRLVYMMVIVSAIIFGEMKKEGASLRSLNSENRWLFLIIGVLFAGFNYFMQLGYAIAPNIGYINAINAASIALVAVGAAVFFHDDFNPRKFIGVIGVTAGLILLVL